MKKFFLFLILASLTLVSCAEKPDTLSKAQLRAQAVAKAHGIDAFNTLNQIAFTWGVAREGGNFERRWIWNTQEDLVTRIAQKDTVTYNWKALDSVSNEINKGFINDKYWLVAPLQLEWDKESYEVSLEENVVSLGNEEVLDKLTITYGNEGGYTPGDAYDFYIDDTNTVREWVFRRGAAEEASIVSICEDYLSLGGLLIAQRHQRAGQDGYLYLTDIQIE
ncbi:MAG: hypothetical protein O2869_03330 [Bacteroidetes bacterium]|nr:hypothetical protein [Bacteroidota bacterium]MDA0950642.1 hypothetical protein [Bacteroidota bacterium]